MSAGISKIVPVIFLAVLLGGCHEDIVFDQNLVLADKSWNWREKATFEAEIADVSRLYDLSVNTRINRDYPYSNLFVMIMIIDPLQDTTFNRVELTLFKPDGSPTGARKGSVLEYRVPVLTGVSYAKPGKYFFGLEQNMRTNTLPGVIDIGLSITKAGEKL